MEEVPDVYERYYEASHPIVCLDESPHQLISETRTGYIDKGIRYVDYEYRRAAVAAIFMIAEPKAGKRFVRIKDSHDSHQWATVVAHIVEQLYPDAARITLVQDNVCAHRKAAIYEVFKPERVRNVVKRMGSLYILPNMAPG